MNESVLSQDEPISQYSSNEKPNKQYFKQGKLKINQQYQLNTITVKQTPQHQLQPNNFNQASNSSRVNQVDRRRLTGQKKQSHQIDEGQCYPILQQNNALVNSSLQAHLRQSNQKSPSLAKKRKYGHIGAVPNINQSFKMYKDPSREQNMSRKLKQSIVVPIKPQPVDSSNRQKSPQANSTRPLFESKFFLDQSKRFPVKSEVQAARAHGQHGADFAVDYED